MNLSLLLILLLLQAPAETPQQRLAAVQQKLQQFDQSMVGGLLEQWEELYGPLGIPFFATTGNHDWGYADSPAGEVLRTQTSPTCTARKGTRRSFCSPCRRYCQIA